MVVTRTFFHLLCNGRIGGDFLPFANAVCHHCRGGWNNQTLLHHPERTRHSCPHFAPPLLPGFKQQHRNSVKHKVKNNFTTTGGFKQQHRNSVKHKVKNNFTTMADIKQQHRNSVKHKVKNNFPATTNKMRCKKRVCVCVCVCVCVYGDPQDIPAQTAAISAPRFSWSCRAWPTTLDWKWNR